MEDPNFWTGLIATLGFPIVMCGAMFWKMLHDEKCNRDMIDKLTESHEKETDKLQEALDNNTSAISSINTLIERMLDRIGLQHHE